MYLLVTCAYFVVTSYKLVMTSHALVGTKESLVVTCDSLLATRYYFVCTVDVLSCVCFCLSCARRAALDGFPAALLRFMSSMNDRPPCLIEKGGLRVDDRLIKLVRDDIAPGTGVDPEHFWGAFGKLVLENAPRSVRMHSMTLTP